MTTPAVLGTAAAQLAEPDGVGESARPPPLVSITVTPIGADEMATTSTPQTEVDTCVAPAYNFGDQTPPSPLAHDTSAGGSLHIDPATHCPPPLEEAMNASASVAVPALGDTSPCSAPLVSSSSTVDSISTASLESLEDGVLRAYMQEPCTDCSDVMAQSEKRHGKGQLVGWLRAKVSQNKVRFREASFDLDLTYITPRVIAMGYPAHGTEYYIRNPIDRVEEFFSTRHPMHFCVYNLCAERHYDRPDRFHGRFNCFPFEDHNVPPLALMCDFVDNAVSFLNEDPRNVVAIHCKAGKGRTGLMTSCLLLAYYPEKFHTAQEAAHYFDQKRTNDGRALTIPSQQRYVSYYEIMLKKCGGRPPPETRALALNMIRVEAPALRNISFTSDFYFTVATHNRILLDSRAAFPNGPVMDKKVGIIYVFPDPMPTLRGDIKLTFYRRKPFVLSGKESHAFYTWFNTNFCDDHILLNRQQLDKVDKSAAGKAIILEVTLQPLPHKVTFTL